ncbi:winged helix-turn-helix transcriptional regulator [Halorarum salinum]|uniref:Helix-turn-helix domain-containing protein n=1 Tax=Halorarum salinum TaxID=2743089 RepID=A0A7D5LDN5_9EURY|nr:helix-turn-helix domain-containing protein [Halobaculum salinum]QLG64231.1 helix-turn-helix domain-containing protein [Halobaculum salinum]
MSDGPADGRPTRERVAAYLRRHPGLHFNELVRRLDLAPGQAQYHLRGLTADGGFRREEVSGRTHYFPPGFAPDERLLVALLRRETARDVCLELLERPRRPGPLAEDLGVARSTLEWHLDGLVDADVVRKRRDSRGRVTLELADPEAAARALRAVEPSAPDRMLDRFTRLVDGLLGTE